MSEVNSTWAPAQDNSWGRWASEFAVTAMVAAGTSTAAVAPLQAATLSRTCSIIERNSTRRSSRQDISTKQSYAELYTAIEHLTREFDGERTFLSEDVGSDGHHMLSLLYSIGIPAPKVASNDDESLAFAWRGGAATWYIAVSEGMASLLQTTKDSSNVFTSARLREPEMVKLLKVVGDNIGAADNGTSGI